MRPLECLTLLLVLPATATAFQLTCYTDSNCKGESGKIKKGFPTICANVVGRKSCRVFDHQSPGGGGGDIRYTGCKLCSQNCDAYTCRVKVVGKGNTCFSLNEGYRDAFFLAGSTLACLIGRDNTTDVSEVKRNVLEIDA